MEGRLSLREATAERGLSRQSAAKWVRRYREQGVAGLEDRSSRPYRLRAVTAPELVGRVEALRRERWTGQRIAQATGLSRATVSRILARLKLSRMRDLNPPVAIHRYEHAAPGDLLHLDIKQLKRIARPGHRVNGDRTTGVEGAGWGVCACGHRRPLPHRLHRCLSEPDARDRDRLLACRAGLLPATRHPLQGCAHRQRRRLSFARLRPGLPCPRPQAPPHPSLHSAHQRKSRTLIQTALREWAYARPYQHSDQRSQELRSWLHQYNWHRPHASLGQSPPISRAGFDVNNLLRLHI